MAILDLPIVGDRAHRPDLVLGLGNEALLHLRDLGVHPLIALAPAVPLPPQTMAMILVSRLGTVFSLSPSGKTGKS